jgi:hypothetical protein
MVGLTQILLRRITANQVSHKKGLLVISIECGIVWLTHTPFPYIHQNHTMIKLKPIGYKNIFRDTSKLLNSITRSQYACMAIDQFISKTVRHHPCNITEKGRARWDRITSLDPCQSVWAISQLKYIAESWCYEQIEYDLINWWFHSTKGHSTSVVHCNRIWNLETYCFIKLSH